MVAEVKRPFVLAGAVSALMLCACVLEKPDPVSQAAAILHKHPSDFLDQLSALDAMASKEIASGPATTPNLIETIYRAKARLAPQVAGRSDSEKVAILNAWVFDSLGIVPLLTDSNLASSLPSQVIARKQGSCVGLVLLYLALGKTLALPLHPVFLPGHVFIRYRATPATGGYTRNIETLRRGIERSDAFYDSAFSLAKRPWYRLGDSEPRQALGALIFNLANTHRARGDWKTALGEFRLAEEAIPGLPEAVGSQGAALLSLGDTDGARERLQTALAGDSLAEAAWLNLEILGKKSGRR
jgi:regulator of sirC expression with transglutaminase-like and TPR domain